MKKILLMGNQNVGKSVVFSRLTGANVITSNYPGTTIEFTRGFMRVNGQRVEATALSDGDRIRIGDTEFEFRSS